MKNLNEFNTKIEFVLTDIDDTLTNEGQLPSISYEALWKLHDAGVKVIPITGRPAGWCEMMARFWPISGIVGENGGFYFRYHQKNSTELKKMHRWFFANDSVITQNKLKLKKIEEEVLLSVPGCAVASDQFCRLMDLAIDFCEDVPALPKSEVEKIVQIFHSHGAQAKISSIHVNGWFGTYNKLTTTFQFLKNEFGLSEKEVFEKCIFVGDSPNDEPMFEKFPHSFGVANIRNFEKDMKHLPKYITTLKGGDGFNQITEKILTTRS